MQRLWLVKYRGEKSMSQTTLSIIDLINYFGAFNISAKIGNLLSLKRGMNIIDGGAHFYSVYKCKNGWISVGNIEPKFYHEMIKAFNLPK